MQTMTNLLDIFDFDHLANQKPKTERGENMVKWHDEVGERQFDT